MVETQVSYCEVSPGKAVPGDQCVRSGYSPSVEHVNQNRFFNKRNQIFFYKKAINPDNFIVEFYQIFKEQIISVFHILFQRKGGETFQLTFIRLAYFDIKTR